LGPLKVVVVSVSLLGIDNPFGRLILQST